MQTCYSQGGGSGGGGEDQTEPGEVFPNLSDYFIGGEYFGVRLSPGFEGGVFLKSGSRFASRVERFASRMLMAEVKRRKISQRSMKLGHRVRDWQGPS